MDSITEKTVKWLTFPSMAHVVYALGLWHNHQITKVLRGSIAWLLCFIQSPIARSTSLARRFYTADLTTASSDTIEVGMTYSAHFFSCRCGQFGSDESR